MALPAILADSGNDLSARMRMAVHTLRREWLALEAMASLSAQPSPLGRWLAALRQRRHGNVATVALANKLARIAWVVLAGRRFAAEVTPAAAA